PDEMHDADGLRQSHGRTPFLYSLTDVPDAIASTRSASNAVASGFPADRAACALPASPFGSSIAAPIRPARTAGVSVLCGRTSAPPVAASAAALAAWSWSSACG